LQHEVFVTKFIFVTKYLFMFYRQYNVKTFQTLSRMQDQNRFSRLSSTLFNESALTPRNIRLAADDSVGCSLFTLGRLTPAFFLYREISWPRFPVPVSSSSSVIISQGTKFATLLECLRNLGTREQSRKSFVMYTSEIFVPYYC